MWFLQKLRGKMEPFEAKSPPLDNHQPQQHPDSQLHSDSDPSIIIDNDNLLQLIAKDLETLVLSCKDEAVDPNLQRQLVVTDEQNQEDVKEAVRTESSSGSEENHHLDEVRVLEENQEEGGVDDDGDLKEKHEMEIEDEGVSVSGEIGDYEIHSKNVGKLKSHQYPLRLDAEDCSFYIRTGACKFGSGCRFNHPLRKKNQPTKETKKQKEENVARHGPTECKYHISSAGCKYGKGCKFNHGRGKTVKTPVVEYNFVGLPIRPGEKECPYYMRNGSCKYGPSCRFNHPDPTAVGGGDSPTTYGNDGPPPSQPAPQSNILNMPSWSAPRTPDPTAAFVPMMYSTTQNMPPPNPDWNGYQAPAPVPAHLYPSSEQGLPIPPAFFLNNPPSNTNMYTHQQQPMSVPEYPERHGQPDCSYFMKTGVCKYRASCKFHHPQSRISRTVRDQNICTYFSRHGTCKYGKACKYDHPVNYNSNSNPAREVYDGSNGLGPLIQQSV